MQLVPALVGVVVSVVLPPAATRVSFPKKPMGLLSLQRCVHLRSRCKATGHAEAESESAVEKPGPAAQKWNQTFFTIADVIQSLCLSHQLTFPVNVRRSPVKFRCSYP